MKFAIIALIALLFLTGCTAKEELLEKIDSVEIPSEYSVNYTFEGGKHDFTRTFSNYRVKNEKIVELNEISKYSGFSGWGWTALNYSEGGYSCITNYTRRYPDESGSARHGNCDDYYNYNLVENSIDRKPTITSIVNLSATRLDLGNYTVKKDGNCYSMFAEISGGTSEEIVCFQNGVLKNYSFSAPALNFVHEVRAEFLYD